MNQQIFVTGTGTGLGKTMVSSWLCLHGQADYWKPIQSGLDEETDSEQVSRLAGATIHPEAYRLEQPLSPHESARREGVHITLQSLTAPNVKPLIIEGAGGLLVPLNETDLMADLIHHLQVPTLLVASSGLGTINHTLLSLQAMAVRNLACAGVILVGPENTANAQAIEHFGQTPVLARLPVLPEVSRASLQAVPLPPRLVKALTA